MFMLGSARTSRIYSSQRRLPSKLKEYLKTKRALKIRIASSFNGALLLAGSAPLSYSHSCSDPWAERPYHRRLFPRGLGHRLSAASDDPSNLRKVLVVDEESAAVSLLG